MDRPLRIEYTDTVFYVTDDRTTIRRIVQGHSQALQFKA